MFYISEKSTELQITRGCSLARGIPAFALFCLHFINQTELWGEKKGDQREKTQHMHLNAVGAPFPP